MTGPVGRRVRENRAEILRIAGSYGAGNVRVFGSVARGEDSTDSDVDLLVDLAPGTGLVGLGRFERELRALLDTDVDVVPADSLKPGVASEAVRAAVQL
ncbi:MAG: nucleotidyltransferase domain-containing protein [Geodermatophilaceae bacterium]|nr:nucleotidyltransferase domain-containing protein [Geodermatophilaceae bacterium]